MYYNNQYTLPFYATHRKSRFQLIVIVTIVTLLPPLQSLQLQLAFMNICHD